MKISFDPAKRDRTLAERGLDFADAPKVFSGRSITSLDDRHDYGELRWLTYGWLDAVAVAVVWSGDDRARRITSMRRMHRKESDYVGLD